MSAAPKLSRRVIAGLLGCVGVAPVGVDATAPDAELIQLCKLYLTTVGTIEVGLLQARRDVDPSWHTAVAISRIPARSAAGIQAKARVMQRYLQDAYGNFEPRFSADAEMAALSSLVDDLLGHADAPPPSAHPDATLIALCAESEALEREFRATDFEAETGTPEGTHAAAEQWRIADAQAALAERLGGMQVTTLEGARALARAIAFYDAELFPNAAPGGYTKDMMLGALVGGLIGWPDEAGAP